MRNNKVYKEMMKISPGWWNISPNKETYDLYYGILSKRLKALSIIDPFKIKIDETN